MKKTNPIPKSTITIDTFYNWDLPIEDLIASEQKTLDWLLTLDNAEISIQRVKNNIAYLESKKNK